MSRPEDASSIEEIKGSLHHREAQMISNYITQTWMKGILGVLEIKEKHIPPSPLNDLFNEEEIFAEANPKYHYKFTEVQQLLALSMETAQYVRDRKTKDMLTQPQYCLSLAFLRKVMSELPDDVTRIDELVASPGTISNNMPRTVTWNKASKSCKSQASSTSVDGISTISVKDKLLERLANLVMELSFSPIEIKDFWKRQKYCFGQGLIRMALDRMTTQVLYIAKTFNQALIWDVGDVQAEQKFEESNTITTRNATSPKPFTQKRNARSAPVASLQAKPASKGQKVEIPLKTTQQPEQHTSAKKDPKRKKNELFQIVIPLVQVSQAKKSTHALMRGTPEFKLFHEKIEMMVYKILKSTVMKLVDLLEESYKGQETDIFATFRNRE
ncbi:hypothetical protein ACJMK2_024527 [Sinanodonta woodiana]|uniref:Uncharacterized protein n=1 Tax=Sinanodonta woodiana TaxID=1069815 RepID=A0ABD3XHJ8_SINWO